MSKTSSPGDAKGALRDVPVRAILRAIGDAAARWADADFPPRVRVTAAIERRTGYTTPVVEYGLDRLFTPLVPGLLEAAITEELGDVAALDTFVGRSGGRRARAYPAGRAVVVSSQTTVGVALLPALYALCAKCDVLVKDREDALIAAFFTTLAEELPEVADSAAARPWAGGADTDSDGELARADTVVAFGSDDTLRAIRATLQPQARFVGYGHRISIGYLTRRAIENEGDAKRCAQAAARDTVLYDGEGCMSLHALFIERGGGVAPARFAELTCAALGDAGVEFPRGGADPRTVVASREAAFRAALGRGGVYRTPSGDAAVVLDPSLDSPPPLVPRLLPLYSVDGPEACAAFVRAHDLPIEALAIADAVDALNELAAELGAVRVARLGELQAPSPLRYHGGRPRIADFVRWTESF